MVLIQLRQTAADLAVDRPDVRRSVDDPEAVRFSGREGQISFPDPLVKGVVFVLEAVFSRLRPAAGRSLFRPCQTGRDRKIEE